MNVNLHIEDDRVFLQTDQELVDVYVKYGYNEAGMLLDARMSEGEDHFGATNYWNAFVEEMRLLLCTDHQRYAALRTRFANLISDNNVRIAAAAIATAIGLEIGVASTILIGFVLLVLLVIGNVGIGAWCAAPNQAP